jgi:hypothetical protein
MQILYGKPAEAILAYTLTHPVETTMVSGLAAHVPI